MTIPQIPDVIEDDDALSDPLRDMEMVAFEGIKDRINRLDWDEMQHLVAGVLRSMGYKTQVSPAGADRGKDIIASRTDSVLKIPVLLLKSSIAVIKQAASRSAAL